MNFSVIPLSWKIGAGLVLAIVLAIGHMWSVNAADKRGYARAVTERATADAKRLAEDTIKADKETKDRQVKADSEAIARQQEKTKYEATINDLRAAARSGNSGLRVKGSCVPASPTSTGSSTPSGPLAEAGYVLVPEAAASVLDAAADLRQSVLDRSALIDRFNECRAAANAP